MKIDLEKIPQEGLNIETQEPADILVVKEKDVEFKVPLDVSLNINLVGQTLLVKGKVQTQADLMCSRCLKKYRYTLSNNNFDYNYQVAGQTEIDITDDLREGVIILVPIKPLCRPDCKGLCPKCGQDLNEKECGCNRKKVDVKWKGLDKLKL